MTEDVSSDLHDQVITDASFAYPAPRPSPAPPQETFQVRSEDDLSVRSLVLGTLISGIILATCVAIWVAVLAAPMWVFRSLLQ